MNETEAPQDRAVFKRNLCRGIAAQIVLAMKYADLSFHGMAARIGGTDRLWRRRFNRLLDGNPGTLALDHISDMLSACGCELKLTMRDRQGDQ